MRKQLAQATEMRTDTSAFNAFMIQRVLFTTLILALASAISSVFFEVPNISGYVRGGEKWLSAGQITVLIGAAAVAGVVARAYSVIRRVINFDDFQSYVREQLAELDEAANRKSSSA